MSNTQAKCMAQHARGLEPVPGLGEILQYLRSPKLAPAPVMHSDGKATVLDLSATSPMLRDFAGSVDSLSQLIDAEMRRAGTGFAFGRYGEKRALYDNEHFASATGAERRTIHMGIDLFCRAGTPIHTPLDAEVCIIANNTQELDYGPMLVLRHIAGQREFYSLYGHLRLASIRGLREAQRLPAGAQIAEVGAPPENGNWPPHLHFQLIVDLLDLGRDFPGVAYESERDFWLTLSPSPAMFFPDCDAARIEVAA